MIYFIICDRYRKLTIAQMELNLKITTAQTTYLFLILDTHGGILGRCTYEVLSKVNICSNYMPIYGTVLLKFIHMVCILILINYDRCII